MRRLHHLGIVTATLIVSLVFPLHIGVKPLGIEAVSAQTREQKNQEALKLFWLGAKQLEENQYKEALDTFQKALVIIKEVGVPKGELSILYGIAEAYTKLGQPSKALDYYEQALVVSKKIPDMSVQGDTIEKIATVYLDLRQYSKALEYYEQALAISIQINDKLKQVFAFNSIALVYRELGQSSKALQYLDKALAVTETIDDVFYKVATLKSIGLAYESLGQYANALRYLKQNLLLCQQIRETGCVSYTFYSIGLIYDNLGQYPQALDYLNQALETTKKFKNKDGEASTINGIGDVYSHLGQYKKALSYYEQALVIHKKNNEKEGEASTLNSMGLAYRNLQKYLQAAKNFQQALVICQDINYKKGIGATLNNLGLIYRDLGQYTQALATYTQASVIARELGDKQAEASVVNNIGVVYDRLEQYPEAIEYYTKALAIRKQIDDKAGVGQTLNNMGYAFIKTRKIPEATQALYSSIQAYESVRPGLKDTEKISIIDTQNNPYKFLQQALIAQNNIEAALEISERSRARAFIDLLLSRNQSDIDIKQKIEVPQINQLKQVAKEQKATIVEYSIISEEFKTKNEKEWRQSKLYIWVIKPNGEVAFKQVDIKPLNKLLKDFIDSSRDDIGVRSRGMFDIKFINPQPEYTTEKLQQLHKILIAPIAELLPKNPNEHVVFIPQESLFSVPFAALQDEQGKYLIEKHTILTAPTIQVLNFTHKQKKGSGDVLVVGNPTMYKIKVGELEQDLKPLAGAEKEAIQIAKLFNIEPLINSKATKTVVMEKMQRARIIHLATHGLLNDFKGFGVPGAIALTPDSNSNNGLDGLLTASEILDMKLQSDLVVLSACDTGRGTITGDGVIGLSRSLISAGARSVLVSLWAVKDNSTAFLMTEFYRNLQQNPDKATALRQAMLTTMKQKEYSSPLHWAAFTLIGEAE